jgi:pectinesterase inhibitor-like protein
MARTGGELLGFSATLLVVVLLAVSDLPAALGDAEFVARTCNNTDLPDQCRALLAKDKRSANATTVLALANIGMDVAAANARDGSGVVYQLSETKYAGTTQGEALVQCAQVYGNAIGDLDDARDPLNSGQYDDASRLESSAEDAGDACEGAFADRGVASVVSDVDRRTKEECGVVGNLIDLLDVFEPSAHA